MGDLAVMLVVSKGNITGVVRRLEHDGLVKRVTSKADRRIQTVSISAKGLKLWNTMHQDYDRIISTLLSDASEAQIISLTQALEKTIGQIEKAASKIQASSG
jgi:DNA-binding MarR family transcriptional regulator